MDARQGDSSGVLGDAIPYDVDVICSGTFRRTGRELDIMVMICYNGNHENSEFDLEQRHMFDASEAA